MSSFKTEFHELDNKFHAFKLIYGSINKISENLKLIDSEITTALEKKDLEKIVSLQKQIQSQNRELKSLGEMFESTALLAAKKAVEIKNRVYRLKDPTKSLDAIDQEISEKNSAMRILIAEDEPTIRFILKAALEERGYTVDCSESVPDTLEKIKSFEPQIILLDLYLAGDESTGMGIIEYLSKSDSGIQCLVVTSEYNKNVLDKVRSLGITEILTKPVTQDQLVARLSSLIAPHER